jgi:pyocin large subunit-like protein
MGSKGASYRYGNTRGSNGIGIPSVHINYQYAKDFNKVKLPIDFLKHGKDFKVTSMKDYAINAVKFANTVDRKNCISFVDKHGSTHKYNKKTNTYIGVDKKGYVFTYFKPKEGIKYFYKKKGENRK